MDLSASKKDLLRLVARMQGVAEKRSTMPALSMVLLTAANAALRCAATDLYQSLIGTIACDVRKPGSVAVSAKDLFERVKTMPDGPVTLSVKDSQLVLKAGGSARRFTLRTMPGEDFPPLPVPDADAATLSLSAAILNELIAKTHFAVSTDETRAHLNSALFEWDGDTVRMVSTDGHRLSKVDVKLVGTNAHATMLISLKALTELRRLTDEVSAGGDEGAITVTQSGSTAFFGIGGMTFATKLVDAQFPPYAQVIPQESTHHVRVPRLAFADALKAVAVSADAAKGGVKFALSKGTLSLSASSPDGGDGVDELACDYSGPNMSTGFNAKYFLDVLGALTDAEVDIGLSGELDPAVIRGVGATTDGASAYLAVIMPLRC